MFDEILGWIASISTCVGVTLNCFNIYPFNIFVMTLASFCYLLWGFRLKERALSFDMVNLYLLGMNIFGTIRAILLN